MKHIPIRFPEYHEAGHELVQCVERVRLAKYLGQVIHSSGDGQKITITPRSTIMDERTVTIILRLIHILAGVFWVGSAFLVAGFLVPTMRETGPEGGRVIQHLMVRRKLPVYLGIASTLTVLSGLTMYVRMAAATHGSWTGTAPGIAYAVGGVAALLGGIAGALLSGAAGKRMGTVGQSIGVAGPSPEQRAEISRLQSRIALGSRVSAALLAVAAGAMAVARSL